MSGVHTSQVIGRKKWNNLVHVNVSGLTADVLWVGVAKFIRVVHILFGPEAILLDVDGTFWILQK